MAKACCVVLYLVAQLYNKPWRSRLRASRVSAKTMILRLSKTWLDAVITNESYYQSYNYQSIHRKCCFQESSQRQYFARGVLAQRTWVSNALVKQQQMPPALAYIRNISPFKKPSRRYLCDPPFNQSRIALDEPCTYIPDLLHLCNAMLSRVF